MSVPTTKNVVPGALVNIVLKADQPTGLTVQGTVSQLLTRGNHPRGIKVRLTDGRVGRVQSMSGITGAALESVLGQSGSISMTADVRQGDVPAESEQRRHRGGWMQRDAREDQPPATQAIGLDTYIKPAKKRGKGKNTGNATTRPSSDARKDSQSPSEHPPELEASTCDTCPVCGDFQGDAAALTHHVQSHFED
ncbi:hypothetical protein N658DRAFT_519224 [Parathielavia hyrcaniae]|uniref:UBZ4-type domain-containing protein n=1 Tax=Parathielavia hyrcaniae TaxID=113614 RepID=A0AAN6SXE7_9PEZI|nr:hypothetical protein N658DRAFT_519224 [Parathielavia hyrcaniae]